MNWIDLDLSAFPQFLRVFDPNTPFMVSETETDVKREDRVKVKGTH